MYELDFVRRAIEDSRKTLEQVRRFAPPIDVLRDVAGSRHIVEGMEQARKFLENDSPFGIRAAALEAKRIVESPGFRAATVAVEKIESGAFAAPLEPTALPAPPPTVEPHVGEAPPDAESDLEGLQWVYHEVLADNDRWRYTAVLVLLALGHVVRQNRRLEFEAMMGWQTAPYPQLEPWEFEEHQP